MYQHTKRSLNRQSMRIIRSKTTLIGYADGGICLPCHVTGGRLLAHGQISSLISSFAGIVSQAIFPVKARFSLLSAALYRIIEGTNRVEHHTEEEAACLPYMNITFPTG